jgi:hypothetical protein
LLEPVQARIWYVDLVFLSVIRHADLKGLENLSYEFELGKPFSKRWVSSAGQYGEHSLAYRVCVVHDLYLNAGCLTSLTGPEFANPGFLPLVFEQDLNGKKQDWEQVDGPH